MIMRSTAVLAVLGALLAAGCGPSSSEASSVFFVPASLDELSEATFFDHPWPSDLRLENGRARLRGYYNPKKVPIVAQYIDAMDGKLDGFSPAAAGFLRFSGPIDPATLPADPKVGLERSASVQLIDIDPASPEYGQRRLVSLQFRADAGVYWLPNTLAFMPTLGFPLRPKTRYAFVVTDKVRAADGGPLLRDPALGEVLGLVEPTTATSTAREVLGGAVDEVEKAGIPIDRIVHFTAFTTDDPTAELFQVADDVKKNVPAPDVTPGSWAFIETRPTFDVYHAVYGPSPNYQAGDLPFRSYGDGGNFNVVNGAPEVAGTFDLRFALTVPKTCPMPAEGYPIALYAHGTGGDFESFLYDGTARELAQRCIATMGVDQIFHGTRPGAPPIVDGQQDEGSIQVLFFNVENPVAARTNPRQGAIDEVQRARLFTETKITVPATVSASGTLVRFDGSKLLYFGHSQGGLSGPLFLASDAAARGGVLSGSSAVFALALTEKTKPEPSVKNLVTTVFLSLSADEAAEVDIFHPAISLAQSIVDVTDPLHYGRLLAAEPRSGFAAKSIYMTEGINPDGVGDSYSPPHGIEAHSIAIGLPLQLPAQRPIQETAWGGPQPVTVPPEGLSGNLAGGMASGVLAQWPISPGDDGHFVIFDQPMAADQAADFLKNLATDARGRVPAP
jgi:hypothetical protein